MPASFVPPVAYDTSWVTAETRGTARRLFARYGPMARGRTVLKIGGVYGTYDSPDQLTVASATEVYLGGHEFVVSDAVAAALTAAGYGAYIVEDFVDINAGRTYFAPDNPTLHPLTANGDEFNGTALAAAWTQRNLSGGHLTFPIADPSIRLTLDAVGDGIYRDAPAGDFELVAGIRGIENNGAAGNMIGLGIVDNSGNGIGGFLYNNNLVYAAQVDAYTYVTGTGVSVGTGLDFGKLSYYRLKKSGNSYTAAVSKDDGATWTTTTHARTFTPTRIGIFRFITNAGVTQVEVTRFNVYPGPGFYA